MSLDEVFAGDDEEQPGPSRRRMAGQTFALAVVASVIGVVLLGLLLYGAAIGVGVLWEYFFGFA